MPELGPSGSVRGAPSNGRPCRDSAYIKPPTYGPDRFCSTPGSRFFESPAMALFALAVGMVPVDPKPTRLVALTSPRERLSPLGASCLSPIKHIREKFCSSQSPTQARPS